LRSLVFDLEENNEKYNTRRNRALVGITLKAKLS
jgi:hypothetical protein